MEWVLDAKPAQKGILLKLVDENGYSRNMFIRASFRGYIEPRVDPRSLVYDLEHEEALEKVYIEEWFKPPFYRDKTEIIVYVTSSYEAVRRIGYLVEKLGVGRRVNTIPDPLVETLRRLNIRPSYPLRYGMIGKGGETRNTLLKLVDNPFKWIEIVPLLGDIDVGEPVYADRFLVKTRGSTVVLSKQELYDEIISFINDADIVFAPFSLRLEIEEKIGFLGKNPVREAIWIDRNSMLTDVYGLLTWSVLSFTPIRMLNNTSIGTVLTTIEALYARMRRYLVVPGYGRIEPWRGLSELVLHDRGGAVFTPKPGVYWNVCQIDFNSLYPNIIARYNVSGETIDDPNCLNYRKIKGIEHKICFERKGLVSEVLGKLVGLREQIRSIISTTIDPDRRAVLDSIQKAVKWILVASFGYLGYRNSVFGSIMAHETVTGIDRYIIECARKGLESEGYKVIHVIVDSIFVWKNGDPIDCEKVRDIIVSSTGFKAKVESKYIWLYIPRNKTLPTAAPNKYFGLLEDGTLKIKGLMAVRRDTPPIVKEVQVAALKKLSKAVTQSLFQEKVKEIDEVFEKYKIMIYTRRVEPWKLVILRRARKEEYKTRNIQAKIVELMNTSVSILAYIMASRDKPIPITMYNGKYDVKYYIRLLEKAREELPR